jgi:sulfate/thiosulfate transport system substrate-binding protein
MKTLRCTSVALTAALLMGAACGSSATKTATAVNGTGGTPLPAAQLSLVAYSTPQEVYGKLISAFQATTPGKNITFTQSYGASGDQSRAVVAGLSADVVNFALEPDMTRLVAAKMVAPDWNAGLHKGMVTDSVAVLVVRKGNPKHITSWDDLTKPGLQVITANPFTSGGARWNVMAAYGAQLKAGKSADDAVTYLNALFKNVPVQDDSARKSLQTFTSGKGDVLIAYESEAIFAQQHGQSIDYVLPDKTILIENPLAVTKTSTHPQQAQAFVDFLQTDAAQKIWAAAGYRPVVASAAKSGQFKNPATLFTIADLGGWTTVNKHFFDPTAGVMALVEQKLGVSIVKK